LDFTNKDIINFGSAYGMAKLNISLVMKDCKESSVIRLIKVLAYSNQSFVNASLKSVSVKHVTRGSFDKRESINLKTQMNIINEKRVKKNKFENLSLFHWEAA